MTLQQHNTMPTDHSSVGVGATVAVVHMRAVPCRGGLSHTEEGFVMHVRAEDGCPMQRRAVPCTGRLCHAEEGCPMQGGLSHAC